MGEVKIGRMVIGSGQTNCYFVYREGSKKVVFIDPADQGKAIYETLEKQGFQIEAILLTHGHFDHILGASDLRDCSGALIYAQEEEKALCEDARKNLSASVGKAYTVTPDVFLKDEEVFSFADITFQVLHTPGHTAGGCSYYVQEAGLLISGDTLFQDSVGRTDFPTGDMKVMLQSIEKKLFVLPEETKVYPGHGEHTTIGHEKKYNPFF